jgi:biopolymer transport protein ExbD
MLSTLAMPLKRGLAVNVPPAATSLQAIRAQVHVTVTQEGQMVLTKPSMIPQERGQRVTAAVAPAPQTPGVRHADGYGWLRTVVEMLDARRRAGVSGLAMAVQSGKKPSG